jgi:hypothetical protein
MSTPIYGLIPIPDGWNAGASSVETLLTNGYVSFRAADPCIGIVAGLNNADTSTLYVEIDYAFYFTKGKYQVMELGVTKTTEASYLQTDVFKIRRVGSEVKYYKNDVLVYTSLTASEGTMILDVSFYHAYDAIYDAALVNDTVGTVVPGDTNIMMPLTGFGSEAAAASADSSFLAMTSKAYAGTSYMLPMVGMGGKAYAMGVGTLDAMTSESYSGLIYLTYAEGVGIMAAVESSATGLTGEIGTGAGSMTEMDGLASNYPLGRAVGVMKAPTGIAVSYPPIVTYTTYAGLTLPFFKMGSASMDVINTADFSTELTYTMAYQLISAAVSSALMSTQTTTTGVLTNSATAVATIAALFYELVEESASGNAAMAADIAARLVELATATGLAQSQTEATQVVAELATAIALVEAGKFFDIEVSAEASDVIAATLRAITTQIESATASVTVSGSARVTVLASEAFVASSAMTTQAIVTAVLNDLALGVLAVNVGGVQYDGWVMNTRTMAASEYQNYSFNSFSKIGQVYYGAKDDGIYRLGGATDDGEPINALVQSGLMDFGTSHYKSIPAVYLGVMSDGALALRVVTTEQGVRTENWYSSNINNDLAASDRIVLGKGLRSRYWEFTLTNVDGADFDVHQIEMIPVVLERRL